MDGWPVWLASASVRWPNGDIVPTARWAAIGRQSHGYRRVTESIDTLLGGVGDTTRQREFRMCITVCRHRALTQAEVDGLPYEWHRAVPRDIAGGPVEVLWSRGVPDVPSVRPCEQPRRVPLPGHTFVTSEMYFPQDCGVCEPCIARASCRV